MASRGQLVSEQIAAVMGASAYTFFGEASAERRKRPPAIEWTEMDAGNRITPPIQQEPDPTKHACATRHVGYEVKCWGRDDEESETLLHALVAAIYSTLTPNAYDATRLQTAGGRPVTEGHARTLQIALRFPIYDEELTLGELDTATGTPQMSTVTLDEEFETPETADPVVAIEEFSDEFSDEFG